MMSTQEFWSKEGGDSYTLRNADVDWRSRITFWRDIIPADVETVFEVGTNVGANLRAIRVCRSVKTQGIEINQSAVEVAQARGLAVQQQNLLTMQAVPLWDLVLTCGVLIHMSPDQIHDAMEQIAAMSKRYVLCIEYEADQEEEVNYRGEDGLLWRRPYGQMYRSLGLQVERRVDAGPGFDRCTAVLLSKAGLL